MYVDLPRYKKHLYIFKNSIQKAGSHPYVNRLEGFMIQCFVLPCKLNADRKTVRRTPTQQSFLYQLQSHLITQQLFFALYVTIEQLFCCTNCSNFTLKNQQSPDSVLRTISVMIFSLIYLMHYFLALRFFMDPF